MDDEEAHHNGLKLGHDRYGEESKTVQIVQVPAAGGQTNPPPLDPVQRILSETGTLNERPIAFGPLWKEILIVLVCTCGPMVQVFSQSPSPQSNLLSLSIITLYTIYLSLSAPRDVFISFLRDVTYTSRHFLQRHC